jgi:hypothetical protein
MIPKSVPEFANEPVRHYTIRVKGRLNVADWAEWFHGLTLKVDEDHGETILQGPVSDQAELYGLLSRLRNLGLTLLLVEYSQPG